MDFHILLLLGECSALWGEPERVAGCINVSSKMPGKRLGDQMYVMPVFVEECNMGMCLSWIVYTVLGVSNHWSGI